MYGGKDLISSPVGQRKILAPTGFRRKRGCLVMHGLRKCGCSAWLALGCTNCSSDGAGARKPRDKELGLKSGCLNG